MVWLISLVEVEQPQLRLMRRSRLRKIPCLCGVAHHIVTAKDEESSITIDLNYAYRDLILWYAT